MQRLTAALATLILAVPAVAAPAAAPVTLEVAETAYIDYLDALGAAGYVESGGALSYGGRGLADWRRLADERRRRLDAALAGVDDARLGPADRAAAQAMRRSLAAQAADGDGDGDGADSPGPACRDAQRRDLDYPGLREALVACFVEYGNQLQFEGGTIDRGTALQLLHVVDDPARRRAIFDAFVPLWTALNGRNEADSPYRRMIAMAARAPESEIAAAARAIGTDVAGVERWLVQLLEAWRDASPATPVEPWDFRFVNGAANRELQQRIPGDSLMPVNERFYRDLGADLAQLGVVYDLESRPDKSPLAYSDFLRRGRVVDGAWQRPLARVLGTYPTGGLFSLNELVHENGHAVHVSAIRTRPAWMDWPDTLFTEAFADVPAWSVHEPAWQQRYLGTSVSESSSMRALFANVMLDVAWSLFELRLLRDPGADPNALWTDITHRYLHIVPHPEVPWWAMRVQLAGNPGYMINYGLGAVLTAEIRARARAAIGPYDTGNVQWYPWLSERLLRYGSERDTLTLLHELLGRPLSPDALLLEVRRIGDPR